MRTSRHVINVRKWDTRMDILRKCSLTSARLFKEGGQEMEKRPRTCTLSASPPWYRQIDWAVFLEMGKARPQQVGMESVAAWSKSSGSCSPMHAARASSCARSLAIGAAVPNSSVLLLYPWSFPVLQRPPQTRVRTWAWVWPDRMPTDHAVPGGALLLPVSTLTPKSGQGCC